MSSLSLPPRARLLALGVIVAGGATAGVGLSHAGHWSAGDAAAAVAFTLLLAASQRLSIAVRTGKDTEYFSVADAIWLTAVLTGGMGVAIVAAVAGTALGQAWQRVTPLKVAFNAGQVALSVGAATAVFALCGRPSIDDPVAWAAAAAAIAACFAINLLTVAAMISLVQARPLRTVLATPLRADLLHLAGSLALAVLTALVWDASPLATAFVAVLLGLLFLAYRGWLRSDRESALMEEMARTADEIARGGTLSTRLPVATEGERLTGLAATLNHMLDRLQSSFERERRFIREAGHELRTPITISRGHVEVLGLEPEPDELRATVALLLDEFDRMGRLLEDMSALEHADHPNFVRPSDVPLAPFLDDVAHKVRPLLGDRLTTHSTLNGAVISADPHRLTQALLNLLQNAAIHAAPDAPVELRVRAHDDAVRFEVRDHGDGVPAGKEDAVFTPFFRASHVRPGSGLGLALVRSIAEAHGGRAGVESVPGVGATFWLTVPR